MNLGIFQVRLVGNGSVVKLNGMTLPGVRDVRIHQPIDSKPIITIEFVAEEIIGDAPNFDGDDK